MPSQYTTRNFVSGGTYHIYNKSSDNKILFKDETDYKTFLFYLFIYLQPLKTVLKVYENLPFRLQIKNLHKEIDCLAFCLMPDHFHILLKQTSEDAIPKLMKQVTNAYTEYYNKKYNTQGPLLRGRYKAVTIEKDQQILQLARYIHLHPVIVKLTKNANEYQWSSMREYENKATEAICNKRIILSYYSSEKAHSSFVNDIEDYHKHLHSLNSLIIER